MTDQDKIKVDGIFAVLRLAVSEPHILELALDRLIINEKDNFSILKDAVEIYGL